MTRIRQTAFSHRIEECLRNTGSFDQQKCNSSLYKVVTQQKDKTSPTGTPEEGGKVMRGLNFSDHIGLVMLLIERAYRSLREETDTGTFARAVAKALQTYADPIIDGDYACFPYPYFLFHGLDKLTTEEVARKLEKNGRIMHETLACRARFMAKHGGPVYLEQETKMLMEEGAAEDTSGICCYLTKASEEYPHGTDHSYIAKVSFFLDMHDKEIIVITIQGQRIQRGNKERSRDFARLAHNLGIDPRAYILKYICKIGRQEAYQKIRVIKPHVHPMFLDSHEGFMARYAPVIREAGITEECCCYLEGSLSASDG